MQWAIASVGGNMTAALTLMAKERGRPKIAAHCLTAAGNAEQLRGLPPALIINGEHAITGTPRHGQPSRRPPATCAAS